VTADGRFTAALRALTAALDELGAPSMIIGGIAVIAAGVPRETVDIDVAVLGRAVSLEETIAVLGRHGIAPRIEDALQFARERQVLLLRHDGSGVTLELAFAWLPFEEEALSRALEIVVENVSVRIARPEDLIVYKAAAWRDRDRSDIERLLVLYLDRIDLNRVRALVSDIGAALGEPDRVMVLDEMIERVRLRR
jgi:predicted nucleotidyltransferase